MDNDRLVVVFTDTRPTLARMLCNRLIEEGIEAFVENEELRQAGGDLPLGWTTAPRVVVPEPDVDAARAIVADFTREAEQAAAADEAQHSAGFQTHGDNDSENDAAEAESSAGNTAASQRLAIATTCPRCRHRRLAQCPYCHTATSDIKLADAQDHTSNEDADEEAPLLLMCATCDEPFEPGFWRRCEWCGHDFGEGIVPVEVEPAEPINDRVILVAIGAGLLIALILAYFGLIVK